MFYHIRARLYGEFGRYLEVALYFLALIELYREDCASDTRFAGIQFTVNIGLPKNSHVFI